MIEILSKILHSGPKTMLQLMKMIELNFKMTENLGPHSDIWPRFLSEKISPRSWPTGKWQADTLKVKSKGLSYMLNVHALIGRATKFNLDRVFE